MPLSSQSQSSSSSKSSINSSSIQMPLSSNEPSNLTDSLKTNTNLITATSAAEASAKNTSSSSYNSSGAENKKPLTMKTMQLPKMNSSLRRNSDTILMNQYLKLPINTHSNKKVMFKTSTAATNETTSERTIEDSSVSVKKTTATTTTTTTINRDRSRTKSNNELVEEEPEELLANNAASASSSAVHELLDRECSQTSLAFSDYNDSSSAHSLGGVGGGVAKQFSSPSQSSPQSPISSPNQSQQSLLHQKLSSLIRLGLGGGGGAAATSTSSVSSNATASTLANSDASQKPFGEAKKSSLSSSKSVVQYLNDKFLRKRHSVSILKFTSTNNSNQLGSSNALASQLSPSLSPSPSPSPSPSSSNFLTVTNSKLEKSASNQSFLLSTTCTPQIRLLTDAETTTSNSSSSNNAITSPTRLKIPFKLKSSNQASARTGSFRVKKKTKRSKSAPINQRKILVNSTFYTLLSTNYGDTLLSSGGANRSDTSHNATGTGTAAANALLSPSSHFATPVCVFCQQKRHSQAQCHIFTTSLQEELMRRTNFSRRNYGSLELLFTLDREGIIQNIGKFRIENGDSRECLNTSNTIHLENPESQTRWYFKYFLGRIHQNYMIEDKNKNICFLSVVSTDVNDRHIPLYKVILWTKMGSQKLTLTYQPNKSITVKQILNHFQIETDKSPKEILDPEIQKELLVLEEQEGSINFKFGVVYAKHGQLTDDEMLSNENGSAEFEKFINLIGDKIRLKGWKRYRGGLDTSSDTTGENSIYTIYEGHEIMFHVSTLLPYVRDSKQQLERKRHIGNDIVTIVFQDLEDNEEPDFNPSSARSQFQHIFALVTYNRKENSYRLKIYSEQSVPPFGPSLPAPPVFVNHKEFREFLLVKLINGEKSAFNNSVFGKRRKRTIEAIITNLYKNYEKDSYKYKVVNTTSGIGEAISDALISGNLSTKRKEEMRKAEFLKIGQNLKLQTIIKGDAPTSQLTTGAVKKELWEPRVFLQSFEHSIVCSDSWNNCLVVGTANGVFVIDEALPWDIKQIFDKSVQLRQLDICELNGLMIMCDYRGHISVFKLSDFNQILTDSNWESAQTKTKAHCKEHRLEFIPAACQTYTIGKQLIMTTTSKSNGAGKNITTSHQCFRMLAACGRKLLLIEYTGCSVAAAAAAAAASSGATSVGSTVCNTCANMNPINSSSSIVNSLVQNPIVGVTQLTPAAGVMPAAAGALSSSSSGQNLCALEAIDGNDITKMFQIKKEFTCSDVPNLVNLVNSFSGENYILVSYKHKCELLSERNGECLKQFQFNSMSTVRSIVELYDNHKLEILVTYNYTSEFIKLDEGLNSDSSTTQALTASSSNALQSSGNTTSGGVASTANSNKRISYYTFQWNSEPNYVICAFPYIIGFANQCIEIRLLVNGNLVNSITMSNIKLIASKKDIFFSADQEYYPTNDLNSLMINLANMNVNSSFSSTSNVNSNNSSTNNGTSDDNSPPASPPIDSGLSSVNFSPPSAATFFPTSSPLSSSSSTSGATPNSGGKATTQQQQQQQSSNNQQSSSSSSSTSQANQQPPQPLQAQQSSSALLLTTKTPPCTIYKISLDFLLQSNMAKVEKFNQLCENSMRTIQREISDFSSQFIFTEPNEIMPKQYSFYQKIISSNQKDESSENNIGEF